MIRDNNPDTAHSLLKSLFRGNAGLHPDDRAGTLTVRLLHQPTRAQDLALAPLLNELNRMRAVFPGFSLRLVYKTLADDESCPTPSPPRPLDTTPSMQKRCNGVTKSEPITFPRLFSESGTRGCVFDQ